jgi:GntR family transcriptional regulator
MQLSREAPHPLYHQLKDTIVAEIKPGRHLVHQSIPSGREFSECYKVKRVTSRQAPLHLALHGLGYTHVSKAPLWPNPRSKN